MKALVLTVAGMSSRFSASLGHEALKCVHYEDDPRDTLLYRMLDMAEAFDRIVVVVGFRAEAVAEYLRVHTPAAARGKIRLADNAHYRYRGSGWSLYLGLEALEKEAKCGYIVFAEGDLFLDADGFREAANACCDLVTTGHAPIDARTAVALYFDAVGRPRFVYDVAHGLLEIREPFRSVHSSGQVWGFADPALLSAIRAELPEQAHYGTNLVLVNEYFRRTDPDRVKRLHFKTWINCNTIADYREAFGKHGGTNNGH